MNIQHLKAIVLANQLGSISAAARELGKRQSQVSQWVSDLEDDFGVCFFERTGNRITLSEAGQTLLPMIMHTVSQAEKLAACSQALAEKEPVKFRLGIDSYLPQASLIDVFKHLLAEDVSVSAPLNLEVFTDQRVHLLVLLEQQALDMVLLSESEAMHYNRLEYCRLGSYSEVLVCGPTHPLVKLDSVTAADLTEHRELIWSHEDLATEEEAGYSASYACLTDLNSLLSLLKAGVGYAFLPEATIEDSLSDKALKIIKTDFEQTRIQRRVELVWQPGVSLTQQGKRCLQLFQQHHHFNA